jgi:hypothetical protein
MERQVKHPRNLGISEVNSKNRPLANEVIKFRQRPDFISFVAPIEL